VELAHLDIAYCKGVGAKRADTLRKELKVETALDLLRVYPYKYTDRSRFYQIHEISDEETTVQIVGEILDWHTIGAGKGKRLSAIFTDGRHNIELVWFKGVQYIKLEKGVQYLLFGKPSRFNHTYNFVHPELTPMSKVTPQMIQGLEPDYNTTEKMKACGLNSKGVRSIIASLMPLLQHGVPEVLGQDLLSRYHLIGLTEALTNIHFPKDTVSMQRARERLKFEELFFIQLQILRQMKRREQNQGLLMPKVGTRFNRFYHECLPFELTNAQKRVIKEIQGDMKSGKQMNRLLQGDVGSGKTLVALMCALLAADNGYQTCIMVPTEILANQHYQTLKSLVPPDIARIELLTGSTTKKQREPLHEGLRNKTVDIHRLIPQSFVQRLALFFGR